MLKALLKGASLAERLTIQKYLRSASKLPFAVAFSHDAANTSTSSASQPRSTSESQPSSLASPAPAAVAAPSGAEEPPAASCFLSPMGKRNIVIHTEDSLKTSSRGVVVYSQDEDHESGSLEMDVSTGLHDEHRYQLRKSNEDAQGGSGDSAAMSAHSEGVQGESSESDEQMDIDDSEKVANDADVSTADTKDSGKGVSKGTLEEEKGPCEDGAKAKHSSHHVSDSVESSLEEDSLDISVADLIVQCVKQLSLCVCGFPRHYRTAFRLAHFFAKSQEHKVHFPC